MRRVLSRVSTPTPALVASTSRRPIHLSRPRRASAAYARKPPPVRDVYFPNTPPPADHLVIHDELDEESHFPSWDELAAASDLGELNDGTPVAEWESSHDERLRLFVEMGEEDAVEDDDHANAPSWQELKEEFIGMVPPAPPPERRAQERKLRSRDRKVSSRPQVTPTPMVEPNRARPVELLDALRDSVIRPYIPIALPSSPPQPHDFPLLSRLDWRLSSPLFPPSARGVKCPPNLFQERNFTHQGLNRLVGIGLDPSREARRWKGTKDETWGWKLKVPESERGAWASCDAYRKRPDRLIALSRESEEQYYLAQLSRSGTPETRERFGRTVNHAVGKWVGEMAVPEKLQAAITKAIHARAQGAGSSGAWSPSSAVSVWSREDAELITEDRYQFTEGMILRFTKEREASSRPEPPVSDAGDFVQGHLLEYSEGKLVVAFSDQDIWQLEDGDRYRIDKGLDDSAFALQEQAINNLYYDPDRQRQRNLVHVQGAQEAFLQGTPSTLREWTLQGTSLREILVPDLDTIEASSLSASDTPDFDLVDDSPAAEVAHLPPPLSFLPDDPTAFPATTLNPSTMFADNQLINSWVLRHQRPKPITLLGDPELGLNESQTRAVAMALGEKLSLIQGPPGTGKSQTIVAIIKLLKAHFRIPQPILLAAPTHVSVDHLLSSLIDAGLNPLRIGKAERVRPNLTEWTIAKRQEQHPLWARTEEAREESERCRQALVEHKESMSKGRNRRASKEGDETMVALETTYRQAWRKFIWLEQRLYASLLRTADVFCATAVGSGPSKIMNMIDFPIVFLDEAAMCTEPVTLIPLMKGAQHVTFIGDHKQLPAVVTSSAAKGERLQESLFERLMKQRTVKSVLLDMQYRMRPSISAFPNEAFYHSALQDSALVSTRRAPPSSKYFTPHPSGSSATTTVFISHEYPESVDQQSSLNRTEARIIVSIVADLLVRNPLLDADAIGIISPYAAQTRLLRATFEAEPGEWLESRLGWHRASDLSRVEVNTIDGFQGREKEVIILSTVRSNDFGQIGFLTDKRRLNVALTRAKDALFIVGNVRTLKGAQMNERMLADVDADAGIWRRYLGWLEERNLVRAWDSQDFLV